MKYGIAVSNGTTALETAMACIELNLGDEVIMPTFTIISCALAIIRNRAIPVPPECCLQTVKNMQKKRGHTEIFVSEETGASIIQNLAVILD